MAKYDVSVTKVFGLAITNKATIEAENITDAVDKAKDAGSYTDTSWDELYSSITQDKLTDAYEIAEITINGKVMEDIFFSNHLLREAVEINKGWHRHTGP